MPGHSMRVAKVRPKIVKIFSSEGMSLALISQVDVELELQVGELFLSQPLLVNVFL